MSNLSYSDRLAALNLPSLELRRLRNDVIWCYKILFGVLKYQLIASLSLVLLNARMFTALNCLKGVATLVQGLVFFSERVFNAWNSLPRDTNFNSVAGFKRSIAKVDFTTFLKGDFMLS